MPEPAKKLDLYATGPAIAGRIGRAGAGIPVEEGDKLFALLRNHNANLPLVRVVGVLYNPRTDSSVVFKGDLQTALTTFAAEGFRSSGMPPGTILTSIGIVNVSETNPVGTWGAVALEKGGVDAVLLCSGYTSDSLVPSWPVGDSSSCKAEAGHAGKVFTFQGEVANGAGGAGDQSATVTGGAGGRYELLSARVTNGDTANRTCHIFEDEGTGTALADLWFNTLNAAGIANVPSTAAGTAAGSLLNAVVRMVIAGATSRFIATVLAVAASENSIYALKLLFYGPPPTVTLAGASTPTLTTNVSRVEAG